VVINQRLVSRSAHHPGRGGGGGAPAAASGFKLCYDSFKFRNQRTSMTDSTTRFGFVAFAETWNGRLAMLGFVIGLGTELLTGQGILGQLGLG